VTKAHSHQLLDQNVIDAIPAPTADLRPPARLTEGEKQVLHYTAARYSPDQIAGATNSTLHAIRIHLGRIYGKLGGQTPDEAVTKAHSHQLLEQTVIDAIPAPTADLRPPARLTEGEKQVLHYTAAGYSPDQIAGATDSTLNAIQLHLSHIYGKLGGQTPDEAVAKAHSHQLLEQNVIDAIPAPTADLRPPARLTKGEKQVLHYTAAGYNPDQIADATDSNRHAIQRHLGRIYGNLGVLTADEAVVKAHSHQLLDQTVIDAIPAPPADLAPARPVRKRRLAPAGSRPSGKRRRRK